MAIGEILSFITQSILELPSGVLADLIGRKKTLIIGYVFRGAGYSFLAISQNFTQYVLGLCMSAIGEAFVSGAEEALVYDTLKENEMLNQYSQVKSRESIIYRGILLLSTIAGGYIFKIKAILPYFLTGLTSIIAGIIYIFAKEPVIDSEKFSLKSYAKNIKLGFLESFKDKLTQITSVYYLLIFSVAFLLSYFFEQPFSEWLGFNEKQMSWIFGIIILVNIVTAYFAPAIENRLGYKRINVLLPLITGLFMLFTFKNKIWGLTILLIENIFLGYRFIFTQNIYNKRIKSKHRASAISTINMIMNIFYLCVVYGLVKALGLTNIGFAFNVFGVILIIASAIGIYINRMTPKTNFK